MVFGEEKSMYFNVLMGIGILLLILAIVLFFAAL